jgi:hypothetical protein
MGIGASWTTAAVATKSIVNRARDFSDKLGSSARDSVGAAVLRGVRLAMGLCPVAATTPSREKPAAAYKKEESFLNMGRV